MIKENKSQKEKEIERLDNKIDENLDKATILAGTGMGTVAATVGLASTEILSTSALEALFYPFVGGLVATGIAVIPLTIAAGYGIRKLIKKL